MEDKKISLFDKILNLDEFKNVCLVIAMFASLGFGIFFCFEKGDVPPNLEVIVLALIGAIGGVSAFNLIANRNNNQYQNMNTNGYQYNGYTNNSMGMGTVGLNGLQNNTLNTITNDPPIEQMPIVNNKNSGIKSPV